MTNISKFAYKGSEPGRVSYLHDKLLDNPPRLLSVDIETRSLKDRTIIGIGFGLSPTEAFYIPSHSLEFAYALRILCKPDIVKLFHNSLFDLPILVQVCPDIDTTNILDTQLMCAMEGLPQELASISSALGREIKRIRDILPTRATMDQLEDNIVADKCTDDCLSTMLVYEKLWPEINQEYFKREMQLIPILMAMSRRGIKIDQQRRQLLEDKLSAEVDFYRMVADGEAFNPASTQQVAKILMRRGCRIPIHHKNGKYSASTDEEVLKRISDPIAALVLLFRKYSKLLSTYIIPYREQDRAHTRFHMNTATGRLASAERNMQNIPPGLGTDDMPGIRTMFMPDSGSWTDADFSQQELRVLAYVSQDPTMLDIYNRGLDIHQETADFMGIGRRIAKNVTFCLPMNTQALTRSGWKSYNDISIGDWVLGYNPEEDIMLWTLVMHKYDAKAPVIMFGNSHVHFRATASHRWYGQHRVHSRGNPDRYISQVRTTDQILSTGKCDFRMVLSAPAYLGAILVDQSSITPQQAGILAWVLCDGERRGRILQSLTANLNKVEYIESLLDGAPAWFESIRHGMVAWRVQSKYIRPLLNEFDSGVESFILSLSDAARVEFLRSAIMAEGWTNQNRVSIGQNTGSVSDAIKLAAFLDGNFVRTYDSLSYTGKIYQHHKLSSPYVTAQKMCILDIEDSQPVWCLGTGTSNFVVKDCDGKIFITGNAMIYGASDDTIMETAGIMDRGKAHELGVSWRSKYPKAARWIEDIQGQGLANGYVRTIQGRKLWLPSELEEDEGGRRRKATNFPIQGSAAEMTKDALIVCAKMGYDLVLQVHDELLIDGYVAEEELREVGLEDLGPFKCPIEVKHYERWQ